MVQQLQQENEIDGSCVSTTQKRAQANASPLTSTGKWLSLDLRSESYYSGGTPAPAHRGRKDTPPGPGELNLRFRWITAPARGAGRVASRGDGRTRRAGAPGGGLVRWGRPSLAAGPVGCSCRSGCLEGAVGIGRPRHPPTTRREATTTNSFLFRWLGCFARRGVAIDALCFNTPRPLLPRPLAASASSPASSLQIPRGHGGGGHDEAASGPAGAAPDGQRRHGRHHARLPLRPHLHQGPILLQPLPQGGGGAGGGGGGRGLRQHAVQALRPHRGGGLRPLPPDVLQHEQALRAVRGGGRHPRRRQPLQDLHQPAGPGVADQAVRAPARPRRHGRRPRVHPPALRRRQRHRRPAALHAEPHRPGVPLLQRRVRGEPLPRLHRRARAALHQHPPLRRRGPVPAQRDEGLVERQVHAAVPPALQVRGHRRRQRPGGPLLPADRHRRHLPPRHGHRPLALAGGRHRRRLQAPPPPRVPAGARRRVPLRGAAEDPAAAPHHLPQELAAVPERARHGARGGGGEVRRADRRAGQPHGHAQLRAAGELGGRDGRGARRRAHQHGVPAEPRRAHPGGAVRRAGVAGAGDLQGPGKGHGRQLHGVQRVAGGELAEGPVPGGPFLPQAPLRRAQEGVGRHQDDLPRQAERQDQPHQVHQDAGAGKGALANALTPPDLT